MRQFIEIETWCGKGVSLLCNRYGKNLYKSMEKSLKDET